MFYPLRLQKRSWLLCNLFSGTSKGLGHANLLFSRLNFPSCNIGLHFQSLIILVLEYRTTLKPLTDIVSRRNYWKPVIQYDFELVKPLNYHFLQLSVQLFANQSILSTLSKAWLKSRYSASAVFPQFIKEANQLKIEARLLW